MERVEILGVRCARNCRKVLSTCARLLTKLYDVWTSEIKIYFVIHYLLLCLNCRETIFPFQLHFLCVIIFLSPTHKKISIFRQYHFFTTVASSTAISHQSSHVSCTWNSAGSVPKWSAVTASAAVCQALRGSDTETRCDHLQELAPVTCWTETSCVHSFGNLQVDINYFQMIKNLLQY